MGVLSTLVTPHTSKIIGASVLQVFWLNSLRLPSRGGLTLAAFTEYLVLRHFTQGMAFVSFRFDSLCIRSVPPSHVQWVLILPWQVVMEFTMPWVQTAHQSSMKMICMDSQVQ